MNDVPLEPLAFDAGLDSAAALTPNFELDFFEGVDEDAVAFVAQPERDILVSLLAGSSAVRVPEFDMLSDFVEGAESLAYAVDLLAYAETGLSENIVLQAPHVGCLHGGADGRRVSETNAAVEEGCEFLGSIVALAVELDVEGVGF